MHLHADHTRFARRDDIFYDRPAPLHGEGPFPTLEGVSWSGWSTHEDDHWVRYLPPALALPEQGWKIHLSATPATAPMVAEIASRYCNANTLPFKHLQSREHLLASLAKDADRSSAAKFVTIYPTNLNSLRRTLDEMHDLLEDLPGPYVLSDLRWKTGPMYVRYGAFTARTVEVDGDQLPAIENLQTGQLVPDVRAPSFSVPPWVELPDFLNEQLVALQEPEDEIALPTIVGALHHSNAGGVYSCEFNGTPAVLKEARPNIGFTPDGRDAVTRLSHEATVLSHLPSHFPVPKVLDVIKTHGHLFVVLSEMDGNTLAREVVARNPIGSPDTSNAAITSYRHWALEVSNRLRALVGELHAAGVSHGDLHPGNVIVDVAGNVSLIDFEMSSASHEIAVRFGAPGFVPPGRVTAEENDAYGLAAIELHLFLPLLPLLGLNQTKADELVRAASNLFGLPLSWSARVRAGLLSGGEIAIARDRQPRQDPSTATPTSDLLERLVSTLTSDRERRSDRLWPGDPRQFSQPPWSLEHGALGVVRALKGAGVKLEPEVLTWLRSRLSRDVGDAPLGLMNGLSGAMTTVREFGWSEIADEIAGRLLAVDLPAANSDLQTGLAGLGLALLTETDRTPAVGDKLDQIGAELETRLRSAQAPTKVGARKGGLLGGMSGAALFALEMLERTGEDRFRRLARSAIDYDLQSLTAGPDGSLVVNEGWRGLPYLGHGSAGIGLAIARYLRVEQDTSLELALDRIAAATRVMFVAQAGWVQGRAGLIAFLTELCAMGYRSEENERALAAHVRLLELHLLRTPTSVRVVGNGLLRASCDFATGAAGVLECLSRYRAVASGQQAFTPAVAPIFVSPPVWGRPIVEGGEINGVSPLTTDVGASRL